jgi:PAS domain S-box-containing protein
MDVIIDNRVRSVTFQKKIDIEKDTFEFYFKVEGEFNFVAGQYAWLQFDRLKYTDLKGDRRAFSILNSQNVENTISFLCRIGTSGFKKTMLELKEGDKANVIGPFGHSFCFPEEKNENLVLISSGVGIAPFLSLVRYATQSNLNKKIQLLSFHLKDKGILYKTELETLSNQNKNLKVSHIQDAVDSKLFKSVVEKKSIYYISGTQFFVNQVCTSLKSLGVSEKDMRFENFFPTDEASHMLSLMFQKESLHIDDKESILFAGIQDSSHHLIITDKNGVILFANNSAQKITGFSFEEMKGNTPRLWGGLMNKEFYKKIWTSKLAGNIIDEEIVNRRKNGEIYYVISHISPIKNIQGEVIGFIATEEDITSIKKQEEILKQANFDLQRFSTMTADREIKMIELKKEIKELQKKLNEK